MICYCEGQDNGHEFVLVLDESGIKTYECPVCHRTITETIGEPQE